MAWDWNPYLVGGGTRPDAISGLDQGFRSALEAMFQGAPPEIQQELRVLSAYRSPEIQKGLFANAVKKYGSEAAARKWVAPPGRSRHNSGVAADLRYLSDDAKAWAHANADAYGLHFPMSWEPWHVELKGSRSGGHSHGGKANALASVERAEPQSRSLNALAQAAPYEPEPARGTQDERDIHEGFMLDPRAFMSRRRFG